MNGNTIQEIGPVRHVNTSIIRDHFQSPRMSAGKNPKNSVVQENPIGALRSSPVFGLIRFTTECAIMYYPFNLVAVERFELSHPKAVGPKPTVSAIPPHGHVSCHPYKRFVRGCQV